LPVAEACGSDWVFVPVPASAPNQHILGPQMAPQCSPGAIAYDSVAAPVSAQDFLAAVFGDCTGNWQAAAAPPGTSTPTAGAPATAPATNVPLATGTATHVPSATATKTPVATASVTGTSSRTATGTRTNTASGTPTWTSTQTRTVT